jgi:G3E family GTPase
MDSTVRILLLGGFLGSGKTSILLQIARHIISQSEAADGTQVVIIENEIGDVGVDDKLLRSQGFEVKNLFSGCACCTSSGYLLSDIMKIQKEMNPRWIIIEATGVAYPSQIKETVESNLRVPVQVLAIADAYRWARLKRAMPSLLEAQLDGADMILLNKVDLIDEETAERVVDDLRAINKEAPIQKTSGICAVEMKKLDEMIGTLSSRGSL